MHPEDPYRRAYEPEEAQPVQEGAQLFREQNAQQLCAYLRRALMQQVADQEDPTGDILEDCSIDLRTLRIDRIAGAARAHILPVCAVRCQTASDTACTETLPPRTITLHPAVRQGTSFRDIHLAIQDNLCAFPQDALGVLQHLTLHELPEKVRILPSVPYPDNDADAYCHPLLEDTRYAAKTQMMPIPNIARYSLSTVMLKAEEYIDALQKWNDNDAINAVLLRNHPMERWCIEAALFRRDPARRLRHRLGDHAQPSNVHIGDHEPENSHWYDKQRDMLLSIMDTIDDFSESSVLEVVHAIHAYAAEAEHVHVLVRHGYKEYNDANVAIYTLNTHIGS